MQANLQGIRDGWEVDVHPFAWNRIQDLSPRERVAEQQIDLLTEQLAGMSQQRIPVHFQYFKKDSPRWGEAEIGRVLCHVNQDGRFVIDGSFELALNGFHLSSDSEWQETDPKVWAVVIAHEMLHNLGHSHGARDNLKQMIAFERCLYYDGNYSLELTCPEFECGAREPGSTP